jgi:squalene synthase HpnC
MKTVRRNQGSRPIAPAPWSLDSLGGRATGWTEDASLRYCERLAGSHYENFPVVFLSATRQQRDALAAIYAFARHADDFADEPEFACLGSTLLDSWQTQFYEATEGRATHPVFIALGVAIKRFRLPSSPFLDLLDAFRQDTVTTRYETFQDVLDYCRRSANPVGRLVLKVSGVEGRDLEHWSDCICTALQLTNFWQDLSVDLPRDRVYLPAEDLDRFDVPVESLLRLAPTGSFKKMMQFQTDRVMNLFRQGKPLMTSAGFPGSLYVSAVWLGGVTMLRMVREAGGSIVSSRPSLDPSGVARLLVKSGFGWPEC